MYIHIYIYIYIYIYRERERERDPRRPSRSGARPASSGSRRWRPPRGQSSLLILSLLLRLLDSSFPEFSVWAWEFHPLKLRLCLSQDAGGRRAASFMHGLCYHFNNLHFRNSQNRYLFSAAMSAFHLKHVVLVLFQVK